MYGPDNGNVLFLPSTAMKKRRNIMLRGYHCGGGGHASDYASSETKGKRTRARESQTTHFFHLFSLQFVTQKANCCQLLITAQLTPSILIHIPFHLSPQLANANSRLINV